MTSPTPTHSPKTVLITGANGYIGNAVARAFVRAGGDWLVYGLVRSPSSASALAAEEITPVIGAIDDVSAHESILAQLPPRVDVVVSTTESWPDYEAHYGNVVALLRRIAESKTGDGDGEKWIKPLLIFTSGCKDYGADPTHLLPPSLSSSSTTSSCFSGPSVAHPKPHTEESPLNPPSILRPRTELASQIFDRLGDRFATVLVRPINLYGRSGSYFGEWFDVFSAAAGAGAAGVAAVGVIESKKVVVPSRTGEGREICQGVHVDDCAEGYVALAECFFRGRDAEEHMRGEGEVVNKVEGEVFNISSRGTEETVDGILRALCDEYEVEYPAGIEYIKPEDLKEGENPWPSELVVDFPQWTGDEKLRRVTEWRDRRPLFREAVGVYRRAYEAAKEGGKGWESVKKAEEMVRALGSR